MEQMTQAPLRRRNAFPDQIRIDKMETTDNRLHRAKQQPEQIDLMELALVLLKKAWLIVLAASLGASCAFGWSKLSIAPTYRAQFSAMIFNSNEHVNENGQLSASEISVAKYLTVTYTKILTSRPVIETISEKLNISASYEAVAKLVTVKAIEDTQIIEVTVTAHSPETAYLIAQEIADLGPATVTDLIEGSRMKIINQPVMPTGSSGPNYIQYALRGFLLGGAAASGLILLLYFLDDRIHSKDELERKFGISVIGSIHDMSRTTGGYGYSYASRPTGKEGR